MGWILGGRQGNAGSVANTIEDLLEIKENNLLWRTLASGKSSPA